MQDKIQFYGVRGSIASPSARTCSVGGNTSCTVATLGGEVIILDAGTGLRSFGNSCSKPLNATILFSHLHWDHIQGIPFFLPMYSPESRFTLIGPKGLKKALEAQMSMPSFPVSMEIMNARMDFIEIEAGDSFDIGAVQVSTIALNHPGGAIGYRLNHDDRIFVHLLDHEHGNEKVDAQLVEFCKGADVLVYDSQYLPEEYESRKGWGHSTYEMGARLAISAGVEKLYLAHHDPTRDDAQVTELESKARRIFNGARAAREGDVVRFGTDWSEIEDHEMLMTYLSVHLSV